MMEITECSSIPLETQNSQTSSQDNSLSKFTHDVEVQTVKDRDVQEKFADKEQISPVSETFKSQPNETLKSVKVCKRSKKLQNDIETDKQSKKTKNSQNCESVKISRRSKTPTKQKKDKNPKTVGSSKKCGIRSSKVGDTLGTEESDPGKLVIAKEQKSSKLLIVKKSPNEGTKQQKGLSKPSKELLLSDYVTLSRDWSANRKTYTRNASSVCVKTAGNYDCLTKTSAETNSECTLKASVETNSSVKNELRGESLLNNATNGKTNDAEVHTSAEVSSQLKHGEEINHKPGDAGSVLSELKTDSLNESPVLQQNVKPAILKQKNTKSKRKSVHFSDKIDLPIDSLNRNDIILEIDDVTARSHEECLDHLSDVSANDAVNASIEIDKIQSPVREHPRHVTNDFSAKCQEEGVNNLSNVSADDAVKASIEIDKIPCPLKEQLMHKENNVALKSQEENIGNLSGNAEIDSVECPVEEEGYTKIVKRKINATVVKVDKKVKQVNRNVMRRKRGRPRKSDIINDENAKFKTKVIPRDDNCKFQDGNTDLHSEEGKILVSESGHRKRMLGRKRSVSVKHYQRNYKGKAKLPMENELSVSKDKKQNASITTTDEMVPSQQHIKRKRGRPRKSPLENDSNNDVNTPPAKRMKLDNLETEVSHEKPPVTTNLVEITRENTTKCICNKKKQVVAADILANSNRVEQRETCQELGSLSVLCETDTPEPLVSENSTNIKKSQMEELPSMKANSGEEVEVQYHMQKGHSLEVCDENVSDAPMNKVKDIQSTGKSSCDVHSVISEPNIQRNDESHQENKVHNLEELEILVCSETNVENGANKEKTYRILKSNLESPGQRCCSDLNSTENKSKEEERENVEMQDLRTSETLACSDGVVENEANLITYKRQRLKGPVVEASEEIRSDVNANENKHSKQKTNKNQSLKTTDVEALSELSNHNMSTLENESKAQKRSRKIKKMSDFEISDEVIFDKMCASNEIVTHRKKRRGAANVRMLLKKIHPITRKTKRKKKIDISNSDATENSSNNWREKKSFSCGVCKKVYHKFREIDHHIMQCHNGLARINDDTPFTSEEEISAFNHTLKKIRKLQCLQPNCGKKFISVLGYKYHREHCGMNVPKVRCDMCGKDLKASSLSYHMRFAHSGNAGKDTVTEEEEPLPELPRRDAAVKALKKMENFIKTQKFCLEDEHSNDDSFEDSDYQESDLSEEDYDFYCEKSESFSVEMLLPWKESIKTPTDIAEEISQKMAESWEQVLSETGKLKCDNKNCDKEFTSIFEIKSHLEQCNGRNWMCNLCKRTFSQGLPLYNHMKQHHGHLQETVKDSGESSRKSSYSHFSSLFNTSLDHSGSSRLLKPYLPALEWNIKFRKKHHKNELFSQWKPYSTNWIQMPKKNYSDYLPPLKESAFIKSLEENSPGWTKLGLFECPKWADKEKQKTFFVGGSVWGSAWCPTSMNSRAIQYLALAANSPEPHPLTDCSSRKGLIQIWDMGKLDTKSLTTPILTLAIAHENGSIWDMEWCPSGCWEEASNIPNEKKSDGLLPRLGLLAVACSNSTVRIYSIPHPHSIVKTKDSLPVFRCRPAVVLVCPESAPNISCHRTLCTKVSWQRTNGHSCVAAGFGNGIVCLWNLMSSSPLLTVSQFGGQLTLRPYLSFPAHGACIMGLVWVPVAGGQYLSTASYDRSVKVWNLEDHNWPSLVSKKGLITDIEWLPYWCGVFSSLDDCYNLHHTSTFYKECGYYNFAPKGLSTHFSCIWSLSVSDWLNVEASGDAGGEVIVTVLCQLMKLVDSIKLMSHRRVPLFRISMEALECSGKDEKQVQSEQKNEVENGEELKPNKEKGDRLPNQKEYSGTSVDVASYATYEEAIEKVGLVLQDNNMEDFSAIPEKEFKRIRQPETMSSYEPDQYPLNSVNKVAWNPNLGSHLWLFSAGQAGIARICCVFGLHSDKLKNAVNKCKEKFKTVVDKL